MPELLEKFTIEGIGKSAGIFDKDKLLWLNAHYIKETPTGELAKLAAPFFQGLGSPAKHDAALERRVETLKERAKTLKELAEMGDFYYREEVEMDGAAAQKFLKPAVKDVLVEIADMLESLHSFVEADLEAAFAAFLEKKEIKLGKVAQPLRVALSGKKAGPGLFEMMDALGQKASVERIRKAAAGIA